jgi:DNA polymerase-4
VKGTSARRILHVDLDPFLVSVERSLDPSLRARPVVVGGHAGSSSGMVAAASAEARNAGVRPGQALSLARRLCPDAVFRPGDLETYARFGHDVTEILLAASRRLERPSADEAYLDLTPEVASAPNPAAVAERAKDEIQRRLGLDASLGLASSRLAARVASRGARPRGFLVVLPGYEAMFLSRQPVSSLPDLPPHLETALLEGGFTTLGAVAEADPVALAAAVGPGAVAHLQLAARGEGELPIENASPPSFVQEEATIRDRRSDKEALEAVLSGLARRVCRRLRPFGLRAGSLTVEVRTLHGDRRRGEHFEPGVADDEAAARIALALASPLLEAPSRVTGLSLRLGRLSAPTSQALLFPPRVGRSHLL